MPSLLGSGPATASASGSFATLVSNAVNGLQASQGAASAAEAQSAAGQGNLADTMIAASKASLDTQIATDLLNKAIASYTGIMNMSF